MSRNFRHFLLASIAVLGLATAAEAKCTRLGFSVNDYGKDGPTNDAKKLLDGHIAKWAAENGVKKYTTGKKEVKCELFLDLLLFDEHTCRAEANVCWDTGGATKAAAPAGGGEAPAPAASAATPAAAPKAAPKAPAAKPAAKAG